jgi:hypothetical protein
VAELATAYLDEDHCPGARGLADEDKFKLQEIRNSTLPETARTAPKK